MRYPKRTSPSANVLCPQRRGRQRRHPLSAGAGKFALKNTSQPANMGPTRPALGGRDGGRCRRPGAPCRHPVPGEVREPARGQGVAG